MFGPNRSQSLPSNTPPSLSPSMVTLVSEHPHTSTLCNTNPHTLALPSTVCSQYDNDFVHSSTKIDDCSISPTELPNGINVEKDALIPESPQICMIPDSPQNEGTSIDSKQATLTLPSKTEINSTETPNKQITYGSDATPKRDYGENILTAWTCSILSLSESVGNAVNKSALSTGNEFSEPTIPIGNKLTVPKELTLTNRQQSMTSLSKFEPLDLSNFTQCKPSPYVRCTEEREELLDDSDSELELPQLTEDVTNEVFSYAKQNNALNVSTTVQVTNDDYSETQAEGTEPRSQMLESVLIQSPGESKSDTETKSQDETELFSDICDIPKLSQDDQTRETQNQTILCPQNCLLQNSGGTLIESDLLDMQNDLESSVHLKSIDTEVGEQSHETDTAHPLETEKLGVVKSTEPVKEKEYLDSESPEPLAKRRKLESANAHSYGHLDSEDVPAVLGTQTLELSSEHSTVECSNQGALNPEEKSMDQSASSQEHFQRDTCINKGLHPEPMLAVAQHNVSKNSYVQTVYPEMEATLPEHTAISVYPREPFEGADDGIDTVDQALPTEHARLHALVPNLAKCAREVEQESDNDRDDEGEVGQAVGEPGVLPDQDHQSQAEQGGYTDYPDDSTTDYPQTELAGQFVSEHQIVPDEISLDSSFSSKSMFADELKDKSLSKTSVSLQTLDDVDIENMDDTTVLSLALESIESRRSSEEAIPNLCQDRVIFPQALSSCDIEHNVSNAYSCVGTRTSYRKNAQQSCFTFEGSKGKINWSFAIL